MVSQNGTGTGELVVDIHTPDHIPLGAGFILEAQKPGTYSQRIISNGVISIIAFFIVCYFTMTIIIIT